MSVEQRSLNSACELFDDDVVVERILLHIDNGTTDEAPGTWREPVANYLSETRLAAELALFRRYPTPFCPSAALPGAGSYVARDAAGTPLLAVRGEDGTVRVFRNACRHRGTQVAAGSGATQAFVCPYHAWTYALDGRLRAIPHEHGFPCVDRATHGLVPVSAHETRGLVFVTQDLPAKAPLAEQLPPLMNPAMRLISTTETVIPANWKVFAESFLEGYHIRATHPSTFYPVQYDNLNVVEAFGRNSRIAFPYRAIERLRDRPAGERRIGGKLTYVYHLFPNVMLATFPNRMIMVVLEPLDLARTRQTTYTLTDQEGGDDSRVTLREGLDLVNAGALEDREMVSSVQRGLASRANDCFEFGLFEGALTHFHRNLTELAAE